MWDPSPWASQRPSFAEPVAPPTSAPADAPLVSIQVNVQYIPYILGCLMQGMQPTTWHIADHATLHDMLGRWTDLLALVSNASAPMMLRFNGTNCTLEQSTDNGATWQAVTGWTANFQTCIRQLQAHILMKTGITHPPVPQETTDGSDWLWES